MIDFVGVRHWIVVDDVVAVGGKGGRTRAFFFVPHQQKNKGGVRKIKNTNNVVFSKQGEESTSPHAQHMNTPPN